MRTRFSIPPHVAWPAFVVLLLLTSVGISLAAVFAANSDGGAVPIEGYYARAAAYDEHNAAKRASDALGWTAAAAVEPAPNPALRTVVLTIVDPAGAPVDRLTGTMIVTRPHRVQMRVRLPLIASGPGRYATSFPDDGAGLYDVALDATHGNARFLTTLRVSVR